MNLDPAKAKRRGHVRGLRKLSRQLRDFVQSQRCAGQAGQVQRGWSFWGSDRRMGHRACMAQLQPQPGAANGSCLCQRGKPCTIRTRMQNEVAGLFGSAGVALNLADDRQANAPLCPVLVEPQLVTRRMPGPVAQRIRHRGFRDPVFQGLPAGQGQRFEKGIAHHAATIRKNSRIVPLMGEDGD